MKNSPSSNYIGGLLTLDEDGRPPKTRMESAMDVADRVTEFQGADSSSRGPMRGKVKGLVDGNPPYRTCDLVAAGRAYQCNVNWRQAEAYLNSARSAIYDVFAEAPTYATVTLDYGPKSEEYSRTVTQQFDWLNEKDPGWNYVNVISGYEMVLHGAGPIMFQDSTDWRNECVLNRELLVPEFAKSDTTNWEECAIMVDYTPHKLYEKIVNPKIANELGWNVETVKSAIMRAHPKTQEGGQYNTWEWHQQQLKNRSYHYTTSCNTVSVAHYFFREFPQKQELTGKITHCMVASPGQAGITEDKFLFQRIGRFNSWDEIIHPMYYDNDGGGYHHSVTGLGTKMYSALEFMNRLLCSAADKAFAPKILFKATTAKANEALNIVQWGDYGKIPNDLEVVQTPTGSFLDDPIMFGREINGMLSSNLAQYRQNLSKESGNPITATEAQYRASDQARLGKTQLSHYYAQMDNLYEQKYRRASNPNLNPRLPGARLALEFQQRCVERGVPKAAMRRVDQVIATRIIGQGSQIMRQQSLRELLSMIGIIPSEAGRNNLISDFISSHAGPALVSRYNPPIESSATDSQAFATLQAAAAKTGLAPVVTANQDHMVFAEVFILAASQAAASLEQSNGNPQAMAEVYQYIELLGPPIQQHLQGASLNKMLSAKVKTLEQQWNKLAGFQDKLGRQLEKAQQQAQERQAKMQEAQAMQNGQDPDMMIAEAKLNADNSRKDRKLGADMQRKDVQAGMKEKMARQQMALADASTAADIRRKNFTADNSSSE